MSDGIDNDSDGFFDCLDEDVQSHRRATDDNQATDIWLQPIPLLSIAWNFTNQ